MASLEERLERAKQERVPDAQSLQQRLQKAKEQKQPGMLERTAGAVSDAVDYGYRWATGDVPGRDLPELSSLQAEWKNNASLTDKARMALGYLSSSDPQQVADIAKDTLPGAEVSQDEQGNPIVKYDGKEYYINRPGASGADAAQITGEILTYLPAAKWASLGKTLPRRIGRAIFGEGATSVARDTASMTLGSEQGVNLGRAMMAGLTAGGGEAISPLVARALPGILRNPRFVDKQGRLTNKGKRAAKTAGLDPEEIDTRLAQEFGTVARDAPEVDLPAYGRVAQGRRYGIELTPGQATRDRGMLGQERNVAHQSDAAGDLMKGFRNRQDEAIEAAREDVQGRLSQPNAPRGQAGPSIERPTDAAETVKEAMRGGAENLSRRVDEAYDTARQYNATITPEGLASLTQRVDDAVEDFSIPSGSAADQARKIVQDLAQEGDQAGGSTIRRLDNARKQLANKIGGAQTREDRAATTRIKAAFDEHIDDVFDRALFEGDVEALQKLKEARALRRQYTEQFGDTASKDRIEKIIGQISAEDPAPSEVVNWTLGWSKLGNPKDSRKVLQRLKKTLGADSRAWNEMREAGFFQLVRDAGGDAKSPKQMERTFKQVLNKNKDVLDELYTGEEQKIMRQFMNAANLTQALPSELGNPSQSAFAIRDMLRNTASYAQSASRIRGNFTPGLLFSVLKRFVPKGQSTRAVEQMTTPLPTPRPRAPLATAGGASAGAQNEEELNRELRGLLSEGVNVGKRGIRRGYNLLTE